MPVFKYIKENDCVFYADKNFQIERFNNNNVVAVVVFSKIISVAGFLQMRSATTAYRSRC